MNNVQINDVLDYNLKIYQNNEAFKFSLDSVLLAEFINVPSKKSKILDMCTGNAVIPLILSSKYPNKIEAIELQHDIFKLAKKSIDYNNLEEQINIINDNVLNILNYYNTENFDIVSCNPPYFKVNKTSLLNNNKLKTIARHEIAITLEQIIEKASKLLKNKGYFYLVHRTERLEEIILLFNKYNLRIKNIQFIYTKRQTKSQIILIKAIKNGSIGLKVNDALYINDLNSYKNIFKEV